MQRRIGIIVLSYNDTRVLKTIDSIRRFDDVDEVSVIVIDGGSTPEVVGQIQNKLEPHDILVSEPDEGIFDALNKGLEICPCDYVGWLGSDDVFTDNFSSSEVLSALETHDLYVGTTLVAKGNRVLRKTHSWPAGKGLVKWGFHNPHFSTFGSRKLFRSVQFDPKHPAADIVYFLDIFSTNPSVLTDNRIFTIMQAGGFSNNSNMRIITNHLRLFPTYRAKSNFVVAAGGIILKFGYKGCSIIYYLLRRRLVHDPLLGD